MPYFVASLEKKNAMRVLIDTDAFCKLATCGLLVESIEVLGADLRECGRLPALPYMLRRGSLRRVYGPENCDAIMAIADEMPSVGASSGTLLSELVSSADIDPGEAQLLSMAADTDLYLITGDKRSLRALANLTKIVAAFAHRIVTLEGILLALCKRIGPEEVRGRVKGLRAPDNVTRVCFGELTVDPVACLLSYFRSLTREVRPLALWFPPKAEMYVKFQY